MDLEKANSSNLDYNEEKELHKEQELFKKKINKKQNPIQKIVMKAVKAAIVPMLILLAKILAVTLLICVVVSLFTSLFDGEGGSNTNTDETYNSVVSTESNGIEITGETMQITEDQIKSYIENYDSPNVALKNELLGKTEEIHKWQEDYGYSAMFLITIAFEENINVEDLDDFITDMNTKAATWNTNGYKATKEIAKEYVADDTYAEWANNIETKIQENSLNANIIVPGEQAMYGDGYDSIYVSKAGKTYINYTQYTRGATTCTYADYIYWIYNGEELSIYHNGCGLTSVAIILSGYRNVGMNPLELTLACAKNQLQFLTPDNFSPVPVLNKYGVQAVRYDKNTEYTETEKEQYVLDVLRDNRPVMVEVYGPEKGGESVFTDGMHWIVLLDIDDSTNKVYVSNPSKEKSYPSGGWLDIDYVLTSCVDTIRITN